MKSRRAASSRQSVPKATVARRPSVETSRRKRRDFDRPMVNDRRHRAVGDAGRHGLEAGAFDALDHIFRPMDGCDVDVLDRKAQQPVAHGATDKARLADRPAKRLAKLGKAAAGAPFGIGKLRGRAALIALH